MTSIRKILDEVKPDSEIAITIVSPVKLKGGKSNPMQGHIFKAEVNADVDVYIKGITPSYGDRLQAARDEEEPDNDKPVEVKARPWGTRLEEGLPIIEHKGNYYLEVFYNAPGEITYYHDDVEIPKEDIEGLPPKKPSSEKNKVIVRTIKFESIRNITVDGIMYK